MFPFRSQWNSGILH